MSIGHNGVAIRFVYHMYLEPCCFVQNNQVIMCSHLVKWLDYVIIMILIQNK